MITNLNSTLSLLTHASVSQLVNTIKTCVSLLKKENC